MSRALLKQMSCLHKPRGHLSSADFIQHHCMERTAIRSLGMAPAAAAAAILATTGLLPAAADAAAVTIPTPNVSLLQLLLCLLLLFQYFLLLLLWHRLLTFTTFLLSLPAMAIVVPASF